MSIATTLGIGSGIDTAALIESLSTASKAPKEAVIVRREEANSAKVSALAKANNGIDAFATALSTLISGGALFTQPTSSDTSILTAAAIPGARIGGLSAQMEVRQLAQAQSLVSENVASVSAAIGRGKITLTTATGTNELVIDGTNDNVVGLARAINGSGAGVTASIVEDSNGARLVIKGGTGDAQAFTLVADGAADPGLARFAYDPNIAGGMTRAQAAQDAIVRLDGVDIRRVSNSFTDLIAGVKIDLNKAAIGTTVAIGANRPTGAIRQAAADFAAAYNELKVILDEATAARSGSSAGGPLRGDPGIREMQRRLAQLVSTKLSSAGGPATLAEIGVRTERNGTLAVDTARLDAALESDPDGVEALFNPGQSSSNPLITITSPMGRAKPGTYELTDIVADPLSGKIAGVNALAAGGRLIASLASAASGLVIEPAGEVASATITVDIGLGGALQAIRDALRAGNGPLASTNTQIGNDAKAISADREKMEARAATYRQQLVNSFTAMDKRVTAFKATQSYLEQQIKMWTRGDS